MTTKDKPLSKDSSSNINDKVEEEDGILEVVDKPTTIVIDDGDNVDESAKDSDSQLKSNNEKAQSDVKTTTPKPKINDLEAQGVSSNSGTTDEETVVNDQPKNTSPATQGGSTSRKRKQLETTETASDVTPKSATAASTTSNAGVVVNHQEEGENETRKKKARLSGDTTSTTSTTSTKPTTTPPTSDKVDENNTKKTDEQKVDPSKKYQTETLEELQKLCESRSLSTEGERTDLVTRLQEYDETSALFATAEKKDDELKKVTIGHAIEPTKPADVSIELREKRLQTAVRKLFCGCLAYKTTEETLKKGLEAVIEPGHIVSCKIIRDRRTDRSKGYGFIELDSHKVTDQLLQIRPLLVDGRVINISDSEGGKSGGKSGTGGNNAHHRSGGGNGGNLSQQQSTFKVFVGGCAPEMQREELQKCMQQFGEVSKCKLIMDSNTGKNKGFGFVEFASQEAQRKALQAAIVSWFGRSLRINTAGHNINNQSNNYHNNYHPNHLPPPPRNHYGMNNPATYSRGGNGGGGGENQSQRFHTNRHQQQQYQTSHYRQSGYNNDNYSRYDNHRGGYSSGGPGGARGGGPGGVGGGRGHRDPYRYNTNGSYESNHYAYQQQSDQQFQPSGQQSYGTGGNHLSGGGGGGGAGGSGGGYHQSAYQDQQQRHHIDHRVASHPSQQHYQRPPQSSDYRSNAATASRDTYPPTNDRIYHQQSGISNQYPPQQPGPTSNHYQQSSQQVSQQVQGYDYNAVAVGNYQNQMGATQYQYEGNAATMTAQQGQQQGGVGSTATGYNNMGGAQQQQQGYYQQQPPSNYNTTGIASHSISSGMGNAGGDVANNGQYGTYSQYYNARQQ
eukprot:g3786.t1